jgi:hypothetical protein
VFLRLVGSAGHEMHSCAFGREMLKQYFSWSGGRDAASIKSVMGYITQNMCFCIQWVMLVT